MSCFGETVYASLAQMSVRGQADTLLAEYKVGSLDVFSSAFYTHPAFASSFIRCDDQAQIGFTKAVVQVFQPPKSFDIVHDVFACIELPGLIHTISSGGKTYEVLPARTGTSPAGPRYQWTGTNVVTTTDFGEASKPVALSDSDQFIKADGTVITWSASANGGAGGWQASGPNADEIIYAYGATAPFVHASAEEGVARYFDAVGQWIVQEVSLEIGGSQIDSMSSEWMYLNEELHGTPGRRLEDSIMKLASTETRSTIKNRLYVPFSMWFSGSLSRALKTIAMQLHRIEFRVSFRKLNECMVHHDGNPSGTYTLANGTAAITADAAGVHMREGEVVAQSASERLTGEVRNGGNARHNEPRAGINAVSSDNIIAAANLDFHGLFLNTTTRSQYLNLQSQQLFYTVQQATDPNNSSSRGEKTFNLDFKNAVFEILVAVRNKSNGVEKYSPWKFGGTDPDQITGERDDALQTLSFSLSSTPRTLRGLEASYFRDVYPFMVAQSMTSLKGVYYYPIHLKEFLNGTRLVSGYINASKIDDLRAQYTVNTETYSGNSLAGNSDVMFFCRAYNLVSIKNGMLGKIFQ